MISSILSPELIILNDAFRSRGKHLWFVGGCVRDLIVGLTPHDIDLATDATPAEQAEIYVAAGLKHIPTGLHHGTHTACVGDRSYEVTSLRNTAGEHTLDIEEDLKHRDFTLNAMAADFDGNLIDPLNGKRDLLDGVVRWVGKMQDRIDEDPLRMLRYIRFEMCFGDTTDKIRRLFTFDHVKNNTEGLIRLSGKRIWNELSKVLVHPKGGWAMTHYYQSWISNTIQLGPGNEASLNRAREITNEPVTLLAAYLSTPFYFWKAACRFELPVRQRIHGSVICEAMQGPQAIIAYKTRAAAYNQPIEWLLEAAHIVRSHSIVDALKDWKPPVFRVTLEDVGNDVGVYNKMKLEWADSGFTIRREHQLKRVDEYR